MYESYIFFEQGVLYLGCLYKHVGEVRMLRGGVQLAKTGKQTAGEKP